MSPLPPADAVEGPPSSPYRRALDFLRRVISKAEEDNIFFMAGAITFNLLVAVIPLLLLMVGVAGYVARARLTDPSAAVVTWILGTLPTIQGDVNLSQSVRRVVDGVIAERAGLSLVGAVVLIWISTRLIGTLRTALREIFDIAQDRGIVRGKLFDAQMVVVGGVLFLVNIGVTLLLEAAARWGVGHLGLQGWSLSLTRQLLALVVALASIWVLFLLVYRYLPPRRIPWRTALVAATFMAVVHEAMKTGFGWYVGSVAEFRTAFGNLTIAAVFFLWIYYGSLVFILAGEVAQVYTMNRVRRLKIQEAIGEGEG